MTATLTPESFSFTLTPPGKAPQELTFNKFIPEGEVVPRLHEIAHLLGGLIASDPENVMFLPILDGATQMTDEMISAIKEEHTEIEPIVRPIKLKSYSGVSATDELRVVQDLPDKEELTGKTVVIIDEITDSLRTVWNAAKIARARGAAKVIIVALTDKPDAHDPKYNIDDLVDHSVTGFSVPNKFLLGWGMDVNNEYRNLRHIYIQAVGGEDGDEDKYTKPQLPTLEELLQ